MQHGRLNGDVVLDNDRMVEVFLHDPAPTAPVALEDADFGRRQGEGIGRAVKIAGSCLNLGPLDGVASVHSLDNFCIRQFFQQVLDIRAARSAARQVDDEGPRHATAGIAEYITLLRLQVAH